MLRVQLLGPVEVFDDGRPLELGGPQQRAVIAHLALELGRVVSVDRLVDRLWADAPPRSPLGTLQSYVSRLRRALEPGRGHGQAPAVLVSEAPGYVLRLAPEQIDLHRFRTLIGEARAAHAATAIGLLDEALALWRGPALAGIGPDEAVAQLTVRITEEHHAAIEQRFEALLAVGRAAEAVPALQEAVDAEPLRERRWALLALALYRSRRQAEALRALAAARHALLDELGLDPGPELRDLEARILAQDPTLDLGAAKCRPLRRPPPSEPCRSSRQHRYSCVARRSGPRWRRRCSGPTSARRSWRSSTGSRASASRPSSARWSTTPVPRVGTGPSAVASSLAWPRRCGRGSRSSASC